MERNNQYRSERKDSPGPCCPKTEPIVFWAGESIGCGLRHCAMVEAQHSTESGGAVDDPIS